MGSPPASAPAGASAPGIPLAPPTLVAATTTIHTKPDVLSAHAPANDNWYDPVAASMAALSSVVALDGTPLRGTAGYEPLDSSSAPSGPLSGLPKFDGDKGLPYQEWKQAAHQFMAMNCGRSPSAIVYSSTWHWQMLTCMMAPNTAAERFWQQRVRAQGPPLQRRNPLPTG